jgi:8-oxo-dGTP pyrophosphatase MutT (NUDIX family)
MFERRLIVEHRLDIGMTEEFTGCKLAYIFNGQLLVYKRDDFPHIPFAGMWDFPSGGREGDETPEQYVTKAQAVRVS